MDKQTWADLARPFAPDEIKWRQQGKLSQRGSAQLVAYIDARAVMDRLDEVIGPAGWRDNYRQGPDGGLICRIEILCTVGEEQIPTLGGTAPTYTRDRLEWVGKEDGAENTQIEAVKGGMSDAFKRAAVKWGIGRYLYRLPVRWHKVQDGYGNDGDIYVSRGKGNPPGHVKRPRLPTWALPPQRRKETRSEQEVRRAAHDEDWENGGKDRFFAALGDVNKRQEGPGLTYDALKSWMAATGRPKPSSPAFGEQGRRKLIAWLQEDPEKHIAEILAKGGVMDRVIPCDDCGNPRACMTAGACSYPARTPPAPPPRPALTPEDRRDLQEIRLRATGGDHTERWDVRKMMADRVRLLRIVEKMEKIMLAHSE